MPIMGIVSFTKVRLDYGWLGNMSAHPVVYQGKRYPTTEHLFQALRFLPGHPDIAEKIREIKSPMSAKMCAKKHADLLGPRDEAFIRADLDRMRLCIRLKAETYKSVREGLIATGDQRIIEDVTSRPHGTGKFWGAENKDGEWLGDNWLGVLWMELRASLTSPADVPSVKFYE